MVVVSMIKKNTRWKVMVKNIKLVTRKVVLIPVVEPLCASNTD